MCAPASFSAIDLLQFFLSRLCVPKRRKIEIKIAQRRKFIQQFASANVSIIVDYRRSFARRTRKFPSRRLSEIRMLMPIMRHYCPDIRDVFDKFLRGIVRSEHSFAVSFGQTCSVFVNPGQNLERNLFDRIADLRFAANDVKILSVQLETVPQKFRKLFNLVVIIRTNDRVHIQPKPISKFFFQRIKIFDAIERFLPISRHASDFVMRFAVSVERDIQIKLAQIFILQNLFNDFVNARFYQSICR